MASVVFGPYGNIGGVDGHQRFTAHIQEPSDPELPYVAGGLGTVVPVTFVCECGAGFRSRSLLAQHVTVERGKWQSRGG